jgi:nucleoside-diphosphate-sugar epimerase
MRHLVIGGTGFIGAALVKELGRRGLSFDYTTRSKDIWDAHIMDVLEPNALPDADVVYLCAAYKGYANCDRDSVLSWRTNVDAQIKIGQHYRHFAFLVYLSSDAVEFSAAAYAYQKRHVEAYMNTIDAAIVRPGPVSAERVGEFASVLADIGEQHRKGLTRWQ